jgi:hypothetical protein
MSYYYKYQFTSPNKIYATIKEELKSYFDSGSVDDLMFPTYVDKCLRKLGRGTYSITEDILQISDFQARLPDNFYAVREAWMCTEVQGNSYQSASSFYSQAHSASTIQVSPMTVNDISCLNPNCVDGCADCMPQLVQAIYKTNTSVASSYVRQYLLKPGNISSMNKCDVSYIDEWDAYNRSLNARQFSPYSSTYDSFDIRDNKFVTNFREGIVNLVFYAVDYDPEGNQFVPDNYRIMEYIEAFIKYKVFETLTNQVTDETFNQLVSKLQYYEQKADQAFILAEIEMRKQTPWEKQRRIRQSMNRFNMYKLPNRSGTYRWKRNI